MSKLNSRSEIHDPLLCSAMVAREGWRRWRSRCETYSDSAFSRINRLTREYEAKMSLTNEAILTGRVKFWAVTELIDKRGYGFS
jgi:hypothetical protein